MPGPWPARGSTITTGRFFGSMIARLGRNDARERIVDRALEALAADQDLVAEGQHGRERPGGHVGLLVAALAQDVEEQHGALGGVDKIILERGRGARRIGRGAEAGAGETGRLEGLGKRLQDRKRIVGGCVVHRRALRCPVQVWACRRSGLGCRCARPFGHKTSPRKHPSALGGPICPRILFGSPSKYRPLPTVIALQYDAAANG